MTRLLPGTRQQGGKRQTAEPGQAPAAEPAQARAAEPGQEQPDDARAIELSLREPDLFGVIFDRYFAEIHGYLARRVGRDTADDAAAETFLIAFRSRRQFDSGRGSVRAWLFGIAAHQVSLHRRTELRRLRAMARAAQPGTVDGHADRVAERVTAGAAGRQLAGALAELPGRDREVVLLVALGGLSHAEVAAALGIPYGTVGSRLSRARGKLRAVLAGTALTGTALTGTVLTGTVLTGTAPDRAEGSEHD